MSNLKNQEKVNSGYHKKNIYGIKEYIVRIGHYENQTAHQLSYLSTSFTLLIYFDSNVVKLIISP